GWVSAPVGRLAFRTGADLGARCEVPWGWPGSGAASSDSQAPPARWTHRTRRPACRKIHHPEVHMDTRPATSPPSGGAFRGAKRSIAMALLAIGLLVVGGSAVAFAADPSPAATPGATTAPAARETRARTPQ